MAHSQCLVRSNSELKGWKHCWIKRVSIWQISWQEIHMWARSLISSSMTGITPCAADMTKFTGFALCIHGTQFVVGDKIHQRPCPWNTPAQLFYSPANLILINNVPMDQAHRRRTTRSYNKPILYRLYNIIQRSTNTVLSRSYIPDDLQSIVNVLWFNRREYTEQQSNSDSCQWTKICYQARLSKSSGMARWTWSIDQFSDHKRRPSQKFTFNVDEDFSTPQRHAFIPTLWKHNESPVHVRHGWFFQHEKCIFDNEVVTLMFAGYDLFRCSHHILSNTTKFFDPLLHPSRLWHSFFHREFSNLPRRLRRKSCKQHRWNFQSDIQSPFHLLSKSIEQWFDQVQHSYCSMQWQVEWSVDSDWHWWPNLSLTVPREKHHMQQDIDIHIVRRMHLVVKVQRQANHIHQRLKRLWCANHVRWNVLHCMRV